MQNSLDPISNPNTIRSAFDCDIKAKHEEDNVSLNSSTSGNGPSMLREDEISPCEAQNMRLHKQVVGILVKSDCTQSKEDARPRTDYFGKKIEHGRKEHRVTFKDVLAGCQLVERIEYEQDEEYEDQGSKAACSCTVL